MGSKREACQGLGGNRLPFGVIGKMSQQGSTKCSEANEVEKMVVVMLPKYCLGSALRNSSSRI